MKYCTINAKVKAMRLLSDKDFEAISTGGRGVLDGIRGYGSRETGAVLEHDAALLMHYIHKKTLKKFVRSMAEGLACGEMDVQYYLKLWKSLGVLDKLSQLSMRRVVGTEIDLRNILWMYRLKRYYNIFGESTFGHLVPVGGRISGDALSRLAECKDVGGMQTELLNGSYGDIFGDFANAEHRLIDAVRRQYNREVRQNSNSIVVVCRYLYEKYVETKNVTAVLEATRLGEGKIRRSLLFSP